VWKFLGRSFVLKEFRGGEAEEKINGLPQASSQAKPNKPQVKDFAGKPGVIPV
jgi:hypothetical protein